MFSIIPTKSEPGWPQHCVGVAKTWVVLGHCRIYNPATPIKLKFNAIFCPAKPGRSDPLPAGRRSKGHVAITGGPRFEDLEKQRSTCAHHRQHQSMHNESSSSLGNPCHIPSTIFILFLIIFLDTTIFFPQFNEQWVNEIPLMNYSISRPLLSGLSNHFASPKAPNWRRPFCKPTKTRKWIIKWQGKKKKLKCSAVTTLSSKKR